MQILMKVFWSVHAQNEKANDINISSITLTNKKNQKKNYI